jgi:hypothetical protein
MIEKIHYLGDCGIGTIILPAYSSLGMIEKIHYLGDCGIGTIILPALPVRLRSLIACSLLSYRKKML